MDFRGRLIFPKLVDVARLDTAAVQAAGNYDHTFGEIRTRNRNQVGGPSRQTPRSEVIVQFKAQIETDSFLRQQLSPTGTLPGSRMVIVFLASDLEAAGFLDPTTRRPLFKPTDRLAAVRELNGSLILQVEDPPGLYATQVQPTGFGFGSGGYNLVEMTFEARPQGAMGAGGPMG